MSATARKPRIAKKSSTKKGGATARSAKPPKPAAIAPDGRHGDSPEASGPPITAELPIDAIEMNPNNPRTDLDQAELERLVGSIETHGLLQPVVVRIRDNGRYELIAGGRRLLAAKQAGQTTVAATVRKATDAEALSMALTENIVRCELNPVDTARAVARLCAPEAEGGCEMSQVDAGEQLRRDASWVRHQIRLLKLPDVWLCRVASGQISARMGRCLVAFADRPAVLARVEDDMLANPWAWRTLEDFERNAALIAEDSAGKRQPAIADELPPMRATPGTGERPRESRARKVPSADETAYVPTTEYAGDLPNIGDDDGKKNAATTTPRFVISQILAAIAAVDNLADLHQIARAVEERRSVVKRMARGQKTA